MADNQISSEIRTKTVKVELTPEEHELVKARAKEKGLAVNQYLRLRLLDDHAGTEELRQNMYRILPVYYTIVNRIQDNEIKVRLMGIGETLWQF